jgi:hypothetical protein
VKALETKAEVSEGNDPKAKPSDGSLRAIFEEHKKRKSDLRSLDERCKTLERCVLPELGARSIGRSSEARS